MIFIVARNYAGVRVERFEETSKAEDFCAEYLAENNEYGGEILLAVEGDALTLKTVEVVKKIKLENEAKILAAYEVATHIRESALKIFKAMAGEDYEPSREEWLEFDKAITDATLKEQKRDPFTQPLLIPFKLLLEAVERVYQKEDNQSENELPKD